MSQQDARKFVQMVIGDEALHERTSNKDPEVVLSVARELGLDVTEGELSAMMNREMDLDEMDEVAGGLRPVPIPPNMSGADHCYDDPHRPFHHWVKTGQKEKWLFWARDYSCDVYTCTLCGATKEV